ncbi:MAG: metal-dependent hydrolase, partial [Alphaproteobacteria bacterium]
MPLFVTQLLGAFNDNLFKNAMVLFVVYGVFNNEQAEALFSAVATAVFNALSLTFPDGERLFMDAVRHYRDRVSGKLAEDVRGFIAQEAIHS